MLSRVADSLYWINRYVERAENISRFVEVSEAMALDCPPGSAEPWLPLIDASGDRDLFDELYPGGGPQQVVEFLVRAEANPNSIVNCIAFARENARQIRDVVTTEMWEQINGLYWTLLESDSFWHQPPQEQLREIRRGCQLFYGVTDATLSRDLSWQFSRLGRLLERADKTTRILDVKYFLLLPSPEEVGGVLDELQWISLLRSAGAYQMFRQAQMGVITPKAVAAFLLLDPIFPRSVRYCLEGLSKSLLVIRGNPVPGPPDDLECLSGLMLANWSYVRIDELIGRGLHEAIDQFQSDLNRLHGLISDRYFVTVTHASASPACVQSGPGEAQSMASSTASAASPPPLPTASSPACAPA
jgi:uncharacterized alpha-E superfamily protein